MEDKWPIPAAHLTWNAACYEYALDDIQKGEELVCDYDRFFDQKLWTEFGL